jgi:hypothetical protein
MRHRNLRVFWATPTFYIGISYLICGVELELMHEFCHLALYYPGCYLSGLLGLLFTLLIVVLYGNGVLSSLNSLN